MANFNYSFGPYPLFDAAADAVVENATGGKLVLVYDGAAQPIGDRTDSPIGSTSLTSNSSGQVMEFKANVRRGLVQFGTVAVTVWANEVVDELDELDNLASSLATVQADLNDIVVGGTATWDNISGKPSEFTPTSHSHPSGQVSDSTTIGRQLMTAADAQTARTAIQAGTGNGTSNLTLGTTATTAAAGNHAHAASGLTFSPTGTLTATNVQTAIEQASSTGGGASTSATYVWKYASGGYPAIPATKPTGTLIVQALGPISPPVPSVPAWCGLGPTQAALKYDYVALS